FYDFVTLSGEIFAVLVLFSCVIFLCRRYITKPKRFIAPEMKPSSRMDATFILSMIILLMVSLLGMNLGYVGLSQIGVIRESAGTYPVSAALGFVAAGLSPENLVVLYETNWWIHIGLVLFFLNVLPRSKHFHVILSVPNVFFSRLEPFGKLENDPVVTREVKAMLDPSSAPSSDAPPARFGVKDVTDLTWKTLMDAYTCTECGRCTAACPANITGKKLSPRKIYIDTRRRMKDAGDGFVADPNFSDGKALVGDYITEEELWACTTCGACMWECPVNIEHVPHIIAMRQYLVMEESKAPAALNNMFSNIENNGAPWALSAASRFDWASSIAMPADKVKA
ncbi:MAG: (Fe-S)-binding protein, partial [Bacteroidia bacterium]|nr:(Fe-S)-binding protein [Bacteroidia bacterium]MDW8334726.1 (Fe-S)-binding protein [Bacteroidia bacterium]